MKRGRAVGGGGILMQRYNTREAVCHLLSFSISKKSEKMLLNDRYSVSCGHRKIFQNLTLTFVRMEKMLHVNSATLYSFTVLQLFYFTSLPPCKIQNKILGNYILLYSNQLKKKSLRFSHGTFLVPL